MPGARCDQPTGTCAARWSKPDCPHQRVHPRRKLVAGILQHLSRRSGFDPHHKGDKPSNPGGVGLWGFNGGRGSGGGAALSPPSGRKVLITGGAGFIGSRVALALRPAAQKPASTGLVCRAHAPCSPAGLRLRLSPVLIEAGCPNRSVKV